MMQHAANVERTIFFFRNKRMYCTRLRNKCIYNYYLHFFSTVHWPLFIFYWRARELFDRLRVFATNWRILKWQRMELYSNAIEGVQKLYNK